MKSILRKSKKDYFETKLPQQKDVLSKELLRDIYAYQQLSPILSRSSYLPFSTASLSSSSIAILLNDILINNRKCILEFGSGITTYLLAKLCSINNLEGVEIISVEENNDWIEVVKELLRKDGILTENIHFVDAPLIENNKAIGSCTWYNEKKITAALAQKKVDCVLVDGPSAWREEIKFSRYPALPFVKNFLAENSIVFLDDIHREGEKVIVSKWKEQFQMEYHQYHPSFGAFIQGKHFNIRLFESIE